MSLVLVSVQARAGDRQWCSYVFANKLWLCNRVSLSHTRAHTRTHTHTHTHTHTKVLLLSPKNKVSPCHGCFNTTAVTETTPSFFAWTFGLHYTNISTSWSRHVGRVLMSRFRGAWTNLKFDKEYLFGFETLVFATSGILSMHNQLETLQRESKTWNRITLPL